MPTTWREERVPHGKALREYSTFIDFICEGFSDRNENRQLVQTDSRRRNVEAAINAGMKGVLFRDAASLRQDLSLLGVQAGLFGGDGAGEEGPVHVERPH